MLFVKKTRLDFFFTYFEKLLCKVRIILKIGIIDLFYHQNEGMRKDLFANTDLVWEIKIASFKNRCGTKKPKNLQL